VRDIVVIGGSAGAIEALRRIVRALPAAFPGAIFVVVHMSPESPGVLPSILSRASRIPVAMAVDREKISPNRIYVAPPDHHLLLKRGYVRVTRGPRENRFRPAVDPLFRTAAAAYGPRVVGVILSGGQDDGVLGLSQIKRQGGIAIAQDPDEAEAPSMPESAIRQVAVDHVVRAEDIPPLIAGLTATSFAEEDVVTSRRRPSRDSAEVGTEALERLDLMAPPSPFTCPECGGALWELKDGDLERYQCHVGHGYSSESLVAAQADALEAALWTALRALEEGVALRRRLAARAEEHGMPVIAASYHEQASENQDRASVIRRALVSDFTGPRRRGEETTRVSSASSDQRSS
jgi:two-component system chemotaxis response regulator CheB